MSALSSAAVVLASFALVVVAACGPAPSTSSIAAVDRLFAAWDRPDSPGCGVGVSRYGAIVYERGYGMASLDRTVPITASTVFHLASITKPFTAMSVLLAAEQGLLSLDDDVARYVADWSLQQPVTIRHLLTHTSGIRDAYLLQGWAPEHGSSTDAFIRLLARQRGLNSKPGAEYQYNNGGYLLLGRILERASGQTLGAFADASIFTPLGMTSAYFNGDPVRTAPEHASGYSPQAGGWRVVPEHTGYAGNAGMMSSVRDLLRWAHNFAEVRIGTPELLAVMQTATVLTGGQTTQSGMGFGIDSYRGARAFRTAGGDLGAATELLLFPDQEIAIAVLCNMDSVVMGGLATVNPTELTSGVADALFDEVLEPRPAPPATGETASAGTTPPAPVSPPPDELAGTTGLYRLGSDENQIVSIAVRDGSLTVWDFFGDNNPLLLRPLGSNRFAISGVTLEFSPAVGARPRSWHVVDGGGQRLMELPLVEFDVSPPALLSFAGTYRSDELDVVYEVRLRDASLVLQSSTLRPVFQDGFVGEYVGVVRFLRDARGAVAGFTLNRSAARGVRFDRVKQG